MTNTALATVEDFDHSKVDLIKATVAKEAISWQLQQAMKKKRITKKKLAEMMDTSRTQIDRILDPKAGNGCGRTMCCSRKIAFRMQLVMLNFQSGHGRTAA